MKQLGKTKWTGLLRGILLGLLLVLVMAPAALGARKTVLVHNVQEMMETIGDHTEVVLAPGRYNLSNWLKEESADRLVHNYVYHYSGPAGLYLDGDGLDIAGFKDLTIRGQDTEAITAEIVTEDPYTPVLKFKNCQDLNLSYIRVGHILQQGSCDGAVLSLESVSNMTMEHLDLYGCGTYGYQAQICSNILLADSVIRECRCGLVAALECHDLKFLRTAFKDTKTTLPLFAVARSQLELTDCTFQNVEGKIDNLDVTGGRVSRMSEE